MFNAHGEIGFRTWRLAVIGVMNASTGGVGLGAAGVFNFMGDHPTINLYLTVLFATFTLTITFCAHPLEDHQPQEAQEK
jgi:hypothetical protein